MGRVRYIPNQHALEAYYQQQGRGGQDMRYFSGPAYQRGRGLGGLFGKLFRAAVPIFKHTVTPVLKRGAKFVAKEALKTGVGVAGDMLDGQSGLESLKRRGKAGAQRVAREGLNRMEGMLSGRKRTRAPKRRGPGKRRKTIKGVTDIF